MFVIKQKELQQLRILILFPIAIGCMYIFFAPKKIHLKDVVLSGITHVDATIFSDSNEITVDSVTQKGPASPEHVTINESSLEDLIACPGISYKTAELIIKERSYQKFYDWRDLKDRVKPLNQGRIDALIEAGVKLSQENQE